MAETTGIAWTDATQNFWEGCTKVGPGCDHCYAENRDKRFHDGQHWGVGAPRRRMVDATFRRPLAWNAKRMEYEAAMRADKFWPQAKAIPPQWVFTLSLGDFFDNAVPSQWRADAWAIIKACPNLRWQIVTKRVGNVLSMLPPDWGDASAYRHVGILSTVVTQVEASRDIPKLLALKAHGVMWVGLSVEPQLERIRIHPHLLQCLDWVISGGESRQGKDHIPRPYGMNWSTIMREDCAASGVPFFQKQMGDNPIAPDDAMDSGWTFGAPAGANPAEWPPEYRVRQMPRVYDQA